MISACSVTISVPAQPRDHRMINTSKGFTSLASETAIRNRSFLSCIDFFVVADAWMVFNSLTCAYLD